MDQVQSVPKIVVGNESIDCKLLIFDKDGTLVDYRVVDLELARARRTSVENIAGKEAAELWQKVVGAKTATGEIDYHGPLGTLPTREELLVAATAFYILGHSWEEARMLAQEAYADADKSMKPPYGAVLLPGIRQTLEDLNAYGLKLAIASTDAHDRVVKSFKVLGIDHLFDVLVGPEEVAKGKPAPDMIFYVSEKTSCAVEEAVMIGDSVSDMKMGKSANVKACIGVLTGVARRDELEKFADMIIGSATELRVV